jgi:hypothetical protein
MLDASGKERRKGVRDRRKSTEDRRNAERVAEDAVPRRDPERRDRRNPRRS